MEPARRLRLDGPPGPRLPVPLLAALALSRARRGRRRPATGPPGAAARRLGLLGHVERRRAVDRLGLGIVDRADRLERLAGGGLVLALDGVLDLGLLRAAPVVGLRGGLELGLGLLLTLRDALAGLLQRAVGLGRGLVGVRTGVVGDRAADVRGLGGGSGLLGGLVDGLGLERLGGRDGRRGVGRGTGRVVVGDARRGGGRGGLFALCGRGRPRGRGGRRAAGK